MTDTWISRKVASSIVSLEATSPVCLYFSSYFLARDSTCKTCSVQQAHHCYQLRLYACRSCSTRRYLSLISWWAFHYLINAIVTSTLVENLETERRKLVKLRNKQSTEKFTNETSATCPKSSNFNEEKISTWYLYTSEPCRRKYYLL